MANFAGRTPPLLNRRSRRRSAHPSRDLDRFVTTHLATKAIPELHTANFYIHLLLRLKSCEVNTSSSKVKLLETGIIFTVVAATNPIMRAYSLFMLTDRSTIGFQ